MTSTTIYSHTATDRTPYTYLIGWTQHDKWYYGRRTAKGCRPDDLWVKYFTSSKYVERFRKEHGEPDVIQIRRVFSDTKHTEAYENTVLRRLNAKHNSKMLNAHSGDGNGYVAGKMVCIDPITQVTEYLDVTDPRIGVSLFHINAGMTTVIGHNGERIRIATDDFEAKAKYKNVSGGKLGCVVVKHKNDKRTVPEYILMSVEDEKYLNGTYVFMWQGTHKSEETKAKIGAGSSLERRGHAYTNIFSNEIKHFVNTPSSEWLKGIHDQNILNEMSVHMRDCNFYYHPETKEQIRTQSEPPVGFIRGKINFGSSGNPFNNACRVLIDGTVTLTSDAPLLSMNSYAAKHNAFFKFCTSIDGVNLFSDSLARLSNASGISKNALNMNEDTIITNRHTDKFLTPHRGKLIKNLGIFKIQRSEILKFNFSSWTWC